MERLTSALLAVTLLLACGPTAPQPNQPVPPAAASESEKEAISEQKAQASLDEEAELPAGPSPACSGALTLTAKADAQLEAARVDFNLNAKSGYSWASMKTAQLYDVGGCGATLEGIVNLLAAGEPEAPLFDDGELLTHVDAQGWSYFGTYYSTHGPALLTAVNASGGGTAEGWSASGIGLCHNCTETLDRVVLFYPASARAIVLEALYGYDS